MNNCPCDSGKAFDACCAPYLAGETAAPTPEALMRSRYSAYVRRDIAYLLRTWHSSTRPPSLELEENTHWIGLKVIHAEGDANSTEGTVEFIARCKIDGRGYRMAETSRFVREDGRWVYLDGVVS